jgi:hypothetical protein
MVPRPHLDHSTLKSIAAFTKERAERSTFGRIRKKQIDADDIRRWEKELTRAFELFTVCMVSKLNHDLPHRVDRSPPCCKLTLAKRLPRLDKKLIGKMVGIHGQDHYDSNA